MERDRNITNSQGIEKAASHNLKQYNFNKNNGPNKIHFKYKFGIGSGRQNFQT